MTTVYDVARVAGVSTATVSRVMRGSDLVSRDTRDRVLAVIETLDFVPDATAQGLTRRRKDIIGLVALDRGAEEIDIESASRVFTDHIVHAAEAAVREAGSSLLLTFGRRDAQLERRVRALSGKVDGMLIAEEIMPRDRLLALARRIPVVIIAGSRHETGIDVVLGDNAAGMAELAGHLIRHHRFRRLGLVAGPPDAPDAVERRAAFEQTVLAAEGCVLDPLIVGDFSEESGIAAATVMLRRPALPDAVACANDQMAIGVMRGFGRAGVRVPGDVAVTGYDDIYAAQIVEPQLTTVSQPLGELGTRAARRLLELVAGGGTEPRAEVLPTRLVTRSSCGCPPMTFPAKLIPHRREEPPA
jgi:LacI family transcriptional regulator